MTLEWIRKRCLLYVDHLEYVTYLAEDSPDFRNKEAWICCWDETTGSHNPRLSWWHQRSLWCISAKPWVINQSEDPLPADWLNRWLINAGLDRDQLGLGERRAAICHINFVLPNCLSLSIPKSLIWMCVFYFYEITSATPLNLEVWLQTR